MKVCVTSLVCCLLSAVVSLAQETTCSISAPAPRAAATVAFVERGHSTTTTRVGSPLATLRHRLAQRALARAQARAILAEAAATRQHAMHVSHGSPSAAIGEESCAVSALPPVPEEEASGPGIQNAARQASGK